MPEIIYISDDELKDDRSSPPPSNTTKIHPNSLNTLAPGAWVDDAIIQNYLSIIQQRLNSTPRYRNQFYFMSTYFMQKIAQDGTLQSYNYQEVQTWNRQLPTDNLFQLKRIFIPINVRNMHWTCAIIDCSTSTISYYDTLHGDGMQYLQIIERYLREEWNREYGTNREQPTWRLHDRGNSIVNQNNGYDCGVYVCKFAASIYEQDPAHTDNFRPNDYRQTILHTLQPQRMDIRNTFHTPTPPNTLPRKNPTEARESDVSDTQPREPVIRQIRTSPAQSQQIDTNHTCPTPTPPNTLRRENIHDARKLDPFDTTPQKPTIYQKRTSPTEDTMHQRKNPRPSTTNVSYTRQNQPKPTQQNINLNNTADFDANTMTTPHTRESTSYLKIHDEGTPKNTNTNLQQFNTTHTNASTTERSTHSRKQQPHKRKTVTKYRIPITNTGKQTNTTHHPTHPVTTQQDNQGYINKSIETPTHEKQGLKDDANITALISDTVQMKLDYTPDKPRRQIPHNNYKRTHKNQAQYDREGEFIPVTMDHIESGYDEREIGHRPRYFDPIVQQHTKDKQMTELRHTIRKLLGKNDNSQTRNMTETPNNTMPQQNDTHVQHSMRYDIDEQKKYYQRTIQGTYARKNTTLHTQHIQDIISTTTEPIRTPPPSPHEQHLTQENMATPLSLKSMHSNTIQNIQQHIENKLRHFDNEPVETSGTNTHDKARKQKTLPTITKTSNDTYRFRQETEDKRYDPPSPPITLPMPKSPWMRWLTEAHEDLIKEQNQKQYDIDFPKLPIPPTARRIYDPDAHCIVTNFDINRTHSTQPTFKEFLRRKGIQHMLNAMPLIICKLYEKQFLQRVCIWNDESTIERFHERVKYCIGRGAYRNSIIRIERVLQKVNNRIRYDIYTDRFDNPSIIQNIFIRGRKIFKWHTKLHIPWEERHKKKDTKEHQSQGNAQNVHHQDKTHTAHIHTTPPVVSPNTPLPPAPTTHPLTRPQGNPPTFKMVIDTENKNTTEKKMNLTTFNIQGISNKLSDVRFLLEDTNTDILALQETMIQPYKKTPYFPNYKTFINGGKFPKSKRGIATIIKKEYDCEVMNMSTHDYMFIRIKGNNLRQPHIIANIYVPPEKRDKSRVLNEFTRSFHRIQTLHCTETIIIMGDFNMEHKELKKYLQTMPEPPEVLTNRKNGRQHHTPTRRRQWLRKPRNIDHICIHRGNHTKFCEVLTAYDVSDHFPVTTQLLTDKQDSIEHQQTENISKPEWKRIRITSVIKERQKFKPKIADHNYWEILNEEIEEDTDPQILAETMCTTMHKIADEAGVRKSTKKGKERKTTLPKVICRAIQRRRKLWWTLQRTEPETEFATKFALRKQWKEAKRKVVHISKRIQQRDWAKSVALGHRNIIDDPQYYWKWKSYVGQWKTKDSTGGIQPIRRNGVLLTNLTDILEAWRTHYAELASDPSGNSRKPDKWTNIFPTNEDLKPLPNISDNITVEEVWRALKQSKKHKAPGIDGIPSDLWQCATVEMKRYEEWNELETTGTMEKGPPPETHMSQCILKTLNRVWDTGEIPNLWTESTVVSIPKKGDPLDMDNYRGISLMPTILKILTLIVSNRINDIGEAENRFCKAQAGFRRAEECVTQYGCVLECLQRRRLVGLRSYVLFIDFKKAYDRVPHEALMAKCRRFGITGKCLRFIRNLYSVSTMRVRVGQGQNIAMTQCFPLERGVRQGCPLSPVLFNIFINDLWDDDQVPSLQVPIGCTKDTSFIRVRGAMFADDAAYITGSLVDTEKACDRVTKWSEVNEMEVGISKCGLLEFPPTYKNEPNIIKKPIYTEKNRDRFRIKISDKDVPIVSKYEYLGLTIEPTLDKRKIVEERFQKMDRVIHQIRPLLSNTSIPIVMKRNVIMGVILPKLLYGAEIYGMNKVLTQKAQTKMNKVLRYTCGAQYNSPTVALWGESKIPPICAIAAGRKARGYKKCATLRSYVKDLITAPFRHRKWTWISATKRWMNIFGRRYDDDLIQWTTIDDPKILRGIVQTAVQQRELRGKQRKKGDSGKNSTQYIHSQYGNNSLAKARVGFHLDLQMGQNLILRARIGTIYLAPQLAEKGAIAEEYKEKCPFCHTVIPNEGETLEHMILECRAWDHERQQHLAKMIECCNNIMTKMRTDDKHLKIIERFNDGEASVMVALLLGGEVAGKKLENWILTKEHIRRLLPQHMRHEELGEDEPEELEISNFNDLTYGEAVKNPNYQINLYLTAVTKKRILRLTDCIGTNWSLSPYGVPHHTPGQRPNG